MQVVFESMPDLISLSESGKAGRIITMEYRPLSQGLLSKSGDTVFQALGLYICMYMYNLSWFNRQIHYSDSNSVMVSMPELSLFSTQPAHPKPLTLSPAP